MGGGVAGYDQNGRRGGDHSQALKDRDEAMMARLGRNALIAAGIVLFVLAAQIVSRW